MKKYTASEVRRASKQRDSWWTVLVVDRIAIPLAAWVASYTNIHPTTITLLSIGAGLTSAWYFYSYDGTYFRLAMGAVLYELCFLLDCIDGKLARLTHRGSKLGGVLDAVGDVFIFSLNLWALAFGYRQVGLGRMDTYVIGFWILFLFFFQFHIRVQVFRMPLMAEGGNNQVGPTSTYLTGWAKVLSFLDRHRLSYSPVSFVEMATAALFLGPLSGYVLEGLVACVILGVVAVIFAILSIALQKEF
ncbi:MAG: CDP-alcohol phosphatidyltransferase family protein [Clostridia bacterium]|nr:CDP-alcohol phosphatidyltransferase family protein [Clostridia bacterium]